MFLSRLPGIDSLRYVILLSSLGPCPLSYIIADSASYDMRCTRVLAFACCCLSFNSTCATQPTPPILLRGMCSWRNISIWNYVYHFNTERKTNQKVVLHPLFACLPGTDHAQLHRVSSMKFKPCRHSMPHLLLSCASSSPSAAKAISTRVTRASQGMAHPFLFCSAFPSFFR